MKAFERRSESNSDGSRRMSADASSLPAKLVAPISESASAKPARAAQTRRRSRTSILIARESVCATDLQQGPRRASPAGCCTRRGAEHDGCSDTSPLLLVSSLERVARRDDRYVSQPWRIPSDTPCHTLLFDVCQPLDFKLLIAVIFSYVVLLSSDVHAVALYLDFCI